MAETAGSCGIVSQRYALDRFNEHNPMLRNNANAAERAARCQAVPTFAGYSMNDALGKIAAENANRVCLLA